jgi:hypothetical protein
MSGRQANEARRQRYFGPWATTLDTGPGVHLSTFWQRRMAMLATLNRTTSRVSWTLRALVALCAFAVLALPAIYLSTANSVLADDGKESAGKEPAVEFLPALTPTEERILAALEGPTEMDFTETPLQGAVDFLMKFHNINIQLDNRALEDAAIGSDTPITRKVNNVKLKSGLELLLRDLDLTYLIKNEILLITTKDKADTELLTRTYPVGDLVEQKNAETLIKAITTTVCPPAWDKVGGPGSITYVPSVKGLVISQTRDRHDAVLELLRSLRGARKAAGKDAP